MRLTSASLSGHRPVSWSTGQQWQIKVWRELAWLIDQEFEIYLRQILFGKNVWFSHRRPKVTLRVWIVNVLCHKRVGAALQATVETLYEK